MNIVYVRACVNLCCTEVQFLAALAPVLGTLLLLSASHCPTGTCPGAFGQYLWPLYCVCPEPKKKKSIKMFVYKQVLLVIVCWHTLQVYTLRGSAMSFPCAAAFLRLQSVVLATVATAVGVVSTSTVTGSCSSSAEVELPAVESRTLAVTQRCSSGDGPTMRGPLPMVALPRVSSLCIAG